MTNGSEYYERYKSLKNELIRTKEKDGSHQNLYLAYGINSLLSSESNIPLCGKVITEIITEEMRRNAILNSNINIDPIPEKKEEYEAILNVEEIVEPDSDNEVVYEEMDMNAPNSPLNNKSKVESVAKL